MRYREPSAYNGPILLFPFTIAAFSHSCTGVSKPNILYVQIRKQFEVTLIFSLSRHFFSHEYSQLDTRSTYVEVIRTYFYHR